MYWVGLSYHFLRNTVLLRPRGVTCDAREHYLAQFTGEILAMTGTKSCSFCPK
jgi:hypothetical protein